MAERARYHTKFAKGLNELTALEKVQAADAVAATMRTPGWDLIVDLLEKQQRLTLDALVRHEPVRDAAEYVAWLAEVRGIQIALDAGPTVLSVAEAARAELTTQGATA